MTLKDILSTKYNDAVHQIKAAILQSQSKALASVNQEQLALYYGIGRYISYNTRKGAWGKDAIATISKQLSIEMPGLKGFSPSNLKNMRLFYEQWRCFDTISPVATGELQKSVNSAVASAEIQKSVNSPDASGELDSEINSAKSKLSDIPIAAFFSIGFSHHILILSKTKSIQERIYYVQLCAELKLSHEDLARKISEDTYHNQGKMPNNFNAAIPDNKQAFKAIQLFKDEYLLDFINVEQLGQREEDIDERVIENEIVHNIRNFIMTFGKGFAYIGNQVHYDKLGHDNWIDLLFFNRILRSLVVVELKKGSFKPGYLGQLSHYLHILDDDERIEGENPPLGIILCKDADKTFVEYVLQDYQRPMGVATYRASQEKLRQLLPDEEEMKKLL
jgi:predicted nuclease of restriction endonuclease-like (RecB) superfamily